MQRRLPDGWAAIPDPFGPASSVQCFPSGLPAGLSDAVQPEQPGSASLAFEPEVCFHRFTPEISIRLLVLQGDTYGINHVIALATSSVLPSPCMGRSAPGAEPGPLVCRWHEFRCYETGRIAFTRIPSAATSFAGPRVITSIAPLDAA